MEAWPQSMYYDSMPIDLMVCVCEGYLGGTIVFVRDIRRGERVGWGRAGGGQKRYILISRVSRDTGGRRAGRERKEERKGARGERMNKWRQEGM